jgi:hypothetical protein
MAKLAHANASENKAMEFSGKFSMIYIISVFFAYIKVHLHDLG